MSLRRCGDEGEMLEMFLLSPQIAKTPSGIPSVDPCTAESQLRHGGNPWELSVIPPQISDWIIVKNPLDLPSIPASPEKNHLKLGRTPWI
jgi:hypothetical protein